MHQQQASAPTWHGTTILTVRKAGNVDAAGDGQVSLGQVVLKGNTKKVRSIGCGDVIGGNEVIRHAVRDLGRQ